MYADPMPCGELKNGKDLYGWDIQPGNASAVATAADCIALCLVTTNCNALTWLPPQNDLGKCYLKNVPEDAGALARPAVSSYRLCEDEVVATGGNATNQVATGGNATNETAGASSDGADVAIGENSMNQTAGAAGAGASGLSAPPLFPGATLWNYRSSTKDWTTLTIEAVPTAPKNSPTRPGNSEEESQYFVLVR